jgi:protein gp37
MADTSIDWADRVWNPTGGCDRVSPGCDNCYALTMAKRLKGMGQAKYQRDGDPRTSGPGFGLTVHEDALRDPLKWRKPSKIFVNSMSDLFHAEVPDEFLAKVFAVMAAAPQHTFQILTKRHARMRSLMNSEKFAERVAAEMARLWNVDNVAPLRSPLPNVWLGCSVENQHWADIRIPALLETPAAVRFLSCEPLLGPLDLTPYIHGIGWAIVGGESGPKARPMHPSWARQIRNQCVAADVPYFFKQWGTWVHDPIYDTSGRWRLVDRAGRVGPVPWSGWGRGSKDADWPGWVPMHRASKAFPDHKTLDGFEWHEFPQTLAETLAVAS